MIVEDYISFETAKLLKEKGFDVDECEVHYDPEDHTQYDITHQMAMKWLREEKDVQIEISIVGIDTWEFPTKWVYGFRCQTKYLIDRRNADFSSYEEACEAAIKYCLEKLI